MGFDLFNPPAAIPENSPVSEQNKFYIKFINFVKTSQVVIEGVIGF